MIVRVRRTGGFAGIDEDLGEVDTARLTPDQARTARELVSRLSDAAANAPVGTDMTRYELDVETGDGQHRKLAVVEEDAPPELTGLLQDLLRLLGSA